MRNQHKAFIRAPMPVTRVALALACAASALIVVEWIPVLAFSPYAAVTRMAFSPALAAPVGPQQDEPGSRRSAASPAHKGGKPGDARTGEQCADRAAAAATASHGNPRADDANLALLLDWHTNAGREYGLGGDRMACSAGTAMAAPIPVAAGEGYEMLARVRGGRNPGAPAARPQPGDKANVNSAIPKVAY